MSPKSYYDHESYDFMMGPVLRIPSQIKPTYFNKYS